MNAYLFKTEKSVKIVVISNNKPDYFDISKNVAFSEMLNKNTVSYVGEFMIESGDENNKNIGNTILSILQPDILIILRKEGEAKGGETKKSKAKESKFKSKIVSYNDHACVCIESPEINNFQDYYTLFLLIDQIKSIQSQLSLN